MLNYLVIIQARLGSSRFPNKVMQTVGGIPMVKRVWMAANEYKKKLGWSDSKFKIIVAWPERYSDLDESNVLERFRRISKEFPSNKIVRLTADCPLITYRNIDQAITGCKDYFYFNNRQDGRDVQIFDRELLFSDLFTDREHVVFDKPNVCGCSVNTKEDLERVRAIAK